MADCTEGDVRLEGSSNPLEGRVEVCYDGVWGTVCSNYWGTSDAAVVCRQLGFSSTGKRKKLFDSSYITYWLLLGAIPRVNAAFGQGIGPILFGLVHCNGFEQRLLDCTHLGLNDHSCGHHQDAGVVCETGTAHSLSVVDYEILLIYRFTCQARYFVNITLYPSLSCIQLPLLWPYTFPFPSVEYSNICYLCLLIRHGQLCTSGCTEGEVRLRGSSNNTEGRVEICLHREWGTVCNQLWDVTDARVVCRQLGMSALGKDAGY